MAHQQKQSLLNASTALSVTGTKGTSRQSPVHVDVPATADLSFTSPVHVDVPATADLSFTQRSVVQIIKLLLSR